MYVKFCFIVSFISTAIYGCGFDPHVRQHSFVEIGHEMISTVILFLPLIQEGQLSVTGERMGTKYNLQFICLLKSQFHIYQY